MDPLIFEGKQRVMEHDFVVSALKYRPDTFDSVVGQSTITTTLKNAMRNEQLGKAFLFCGPRGVGKTTCARILAKVINCEQPSEELDPCGECEPCKSFQEGHSLNIHELDAASNNKVEHIRELIEQVRLAPQVGSYKVYIIDEVHMLSQQAFNAFLKTLEEPPEHAIFILATTEKHKVLPTILSRCQIYDFQRIGISDITDHLERIAEREGISTEREALHTIAIKADGALRDALSIFDQLVAAAGNELSYQHVVDSLNILDHEHFFRITEQLLQSDVAQSILSFDDVLQRGFDGQHFLNGLAQHFRDLLMAQDERTLPLLEVGEELQQRFGEQARSCDPNILVEALNTIADADSRYRGSKDQRLLVELTLMQLCRLMGSEDGLKKKGAPESLRPEEKKGEESSPAREPKGSEKEGLKEQQREEKPAGVPDTASAQDEETAEASRGTPKEKDEHPSHDNGEEDAKKPPNEELPAEAPVEPLKEAPPKPPEAGDAATPSETTESEGASEGLQNSAETEADPEAGAKVLESTDPEGEELTEKGTKSSKPKRGFRSSGSLRISDFENDKGTGGAESEAESSPTTRTEKARDPFDQEALRKSWNTYLEGLEIDGARQALKKGPPRIKEEEQLELVLESRMEQEWVEHVKEELLQHLRSELSNHYIDLETNVEAKNSEAHNKPYTAKQHFDRMQEKNPKLNEFRERFGLDLER